MGKADNFQVTPMDADSVQIRPAASEEFERIDGMVRDIVAEIYGHLLPPSGVEIRGNWQHAHVAVRDEAIVGVALALGDWIDDLWIAADARGQGIGARLLHLTEREIARDGFIQARLRLVSQNLAALAFYRKQGWLARRSYPHERYGFSMTEMSKRVG